MGDQCKTGSDSHTAVVCHAALMQPQIPALNNGQTRVDGLMFLRNFQNVRIIFLGKMTSQRLVLVSDTLVKEQGPKVQKVKFSE